MFRHPNYYKNLRKLARNSELHVRPMSGSEACDTDQAISPMSDGSPRRRATGPGPKQQAIDETVPHCDIEEATSLKRQAPRRRGHKPQAPSSKPQATSHKLQAP
jgi:hypothetical protein